MHDFKVSPGSEKKWHHKGQLVAVIRGMRKRVRKGRSTKTHAFVRILSPEEYEAEKLTKQATKQ